METITYKEPKAISNRYGSAVSSDTPEPIDGGDS
jgi:hypothetical protein